jgi:hypothetical protein
MLEEDCTRTFLQDLYLFSGLLASVECEEGKGQNISLRHLSTNQTFGEAATSIHLSEK